MQSDFSMHIFGVLYRKSLHGPMQWKASLLFSSDRIEVSHPSLWSFIYFEMVFDHNERQWSSSSLLHVDVHFPSPICWGICPLQNGCFRCLCCKSVGYKSLGSYFCNLCDYVGLCVCCLPIPCCLGYTPLQCLQGIMVLWGFFFLHCFDM